MNVAAAALIGRDRELAAVQALFDDGRRLVTITGPGGAGKTSLAAEVARRWSNDGGQTWWVAAAQWDNPATLLEHVADQLGGGSGPIIERIAERFRHGAALLVIDNLEHLLGAAPSLVELVEADERVRLLVTSRMATRVRHEHVVPLTGLGPEAVELLVRQLGAAGVSPQPAAGDPLLDTLCNLVDRLPLGIELAAARVPAFGLTGLVDLLGESSSALDDASPGVADHHRSLLGTVMQSCALLTDERSLSILRRASLLGAPFDLDLAATLADVNCTSAAAAAIAELTETHLINRDGTHYHLPVVVADYARSLLSDEEAEATLGALIRWALAVSYRRDPRQGETTDDEHSAYMERLNASNPAVRRVLELAMAGGRDDDVRALIGALRPFWIAAGLLHEGLGWAESAARAQRHNAAAFAELSFQAAAMADYAVGADRALRWTRQGIPAARASGERYYEARLLDTEAAVHAGAGDADAAERAGVAAIEIYRQLGLESFVASASCELAYVYASRGDLHTADEIYTWVVDALDDCGLERVANLARIYWSDVARRMDNSALALRQLELAERGLGGDPMLVQYVNAYRARVFNSVGRYEHAAELATEAAAKAEEFGATTVSAVALAALAESLLRRGRFADAAAVVHRAIDASAAIDSSAALSELSQVVAETAPPGREQTAFLAALTGGDPLERTELHHWMERLLPSTATPTAAPDNPLSGREMNVLVCLDQGLTDRQIADQLFISIRTVQSHVAHIFTKLTVSNRTSAIAVARRSGWLGG